MSIEKERNKTLHIGSGVPTVKIKRHPEEILDLDEEAIAIGRAKLAGIEFDDLYGHEDRVSPELMIRQQRTKIRELFRTPAELKAAFSTPRRIDQAAKDMMIDGVDLEFIRGYCKKQQIDFSDDTAALLAIGFDQATSGEANA